MATKNSLKLRPRRLTKISGSFYLALPLDWVEMHNLHKQRTVNLVIDEDSRLIITPYNEI